jgi:glycosyltransferase involved in cell wall biosynthesis
MIVKIPKKLSIVIPSNKHDSRILEVISELASQENLEDCELLVNLDGPAGRYEESIRSLGISRVAIFHESGSLAEVLNYLVEESGSDLIARADDDDIYFPGRIKTQIDFMTYRKDLGVSGSAMYIKVDGAIRGIKYYPEWHDSVAISFLFNCHGIAHPVAIFRKSQLGSLRYRNQPAEDMDLWVRLVTKGVKFSNINVPLFIYNAPKYSEMRRREMAHSVRLSVSHMLQHYFNFPSDHVTELINVLFDQSTPLSLTVNQEEVLRKLLAGDFFKGDAGYRLLLGTAEKYNLRLHKHLQALLKA